MTEAGHRFCPRCGNGLLPDMAFCPGCGLKVGEVGEVGGVGETSHGGARPAGDSGARPAAGGGSFKARIVIAAVLVAVGAIGYGLLTRPGATPLGGTPGGGVPGTTQVPAPIVGLTITSPTDGQAVATNEVTVIGTAPPGLTITQDITFGPDQHTTVDGTGHWAIKVGLKEGENRFAFRIGDDGSTKQTLRVIYTPPTP
jgi:hypothetical protein